MFICLKEYVLMALEAYKLSWIDVGSTNIMFVPFKAQGGVSGSGVVYRICFSHIFLTAATEHFLSFLKYVITEMLPALLMGPALGSGRSILGVGWNRLSPTWSYSWSLLPKATPTAPLATKTLPHKLNTLV